MFKSVSSLIEAIYNLLNQKTKSADVTEIMLELQSLVSDSISLKDNKAAESDEIYIDLSKLDFEKLKAAFAKAPHKNTLVFDLQQAIENKLEQMLKENPLRLGFYERYQEIIKEYNQGKSLEDTVNTFDKLIDHVNSLTVEEKRVVKES